MRFMCEPHEVHNSEVQSKGWMLQQSISMAQQNSHFSARYKRDILQLEKTLQKKAHIFVKLLNAIKPSVFRHTRTLHFWSHIKFSLKLFIYLFMEKENHHRGVVEKD